MRGGSSAQLWVHFRFRSVVENRASKSIADSFQLFWVSGDGSEMLFVRKADRAGILTPLGAKRRRKIFGGGFD